MLLYALSNCSKHAEETVLSPYNNLRNNVATGTWVILSITSWRLYSILSSVRVPCIIHILLAIMLWFSLPANAKPFCSTNEISNHTIYHCWDSGTVYGPYSGGTQTITMNGPGVFNASLSLGNITNAFAANKGDKRAQVEQVTLKPKRGWDTSQVRFKNFHDVLYVTKCVSCPYFGEFFIYPAASVWQNTNMNVVAQVPNRTFSSYDEAKYFAEKYKLNIAPYVSVTAVTAQATGTTGWGHESVREISKSSPNILYSYHEIHNVGFYFEYENLPIGTMMQDGIQEEMVVTISGTGIWSGSTGGQSWFPGFCRSEISNVDLGTMKPGPFNATANLRVNCSESSYVKIRFQDQQTSNTTSSTWGNMRIDLPNVGMCSGSCNWEINITGNAKSGKIRYQVPVVIDYL